MTTQIKGVLEIDHERGVVYFHTNEPGILKRYNSVTILRVCGLPVPICKNEPIEITLDRIVFGCTDPKRL